MAIERPLLTARWTDLLMLSFAVPPRVIAQLAPSGTQPDLFDGQAYVSVVGFMFRDAKFFGMRPPGHGCFEEVNLRFYVTRETGRGRAGSGDPRTTPRRGVVFVREIAPRPIVAAVARWVYNESYVTRRMRSQIDPSPLYADSQVAYEWQTGRWPRRRWNHVAAHAAAEPRLPVLGSLEEFIVEHYWAYVRSRDGTTWEYRVAHRPWRIAPATDVVWDCDLGATYGDSPLAPYLAARPVSAFVADGSPVQVFRGQRIDLGRPAAIEDVALDTRHAMLDA